jgi:hypothetical protein
MQTPAPMTTYAQADYAPVVLPLIAVMPTCVQTMVVILLQGVGMDITQLPVTTVICARIMIRVMTERVWAQRLIVVTPMRAQMTHAAQVLAASIQTTRFLVMMETRAPRTTYAQRGYALVVLLLIAAMVTCARTMGVILAQGVGMDITRIPVTTGICARIMIRVMTERVWAQRLIVMTPMRAQMTHAAQVPAASIQTTRLLVTMEMHVQVMILA